MISTVKATMHKVVGAMADDLLPPRDLANAAFAVMVWASSKMSAEERDKTTRQRFVCFLVGRSRSMGVIPSATANF